MAFNPTKTRTWRDGVTPATGTPALGSLFNAEFDQLYENDNFLKAYFGTDNRLTVNEIEAGTAGTIHILDRVGIGVVPVSGTNLQIHQADSAASVQRFTNLTTTSAASHGFEIGIDADEQGRIWNYENTDIVIGTNNTDRGRFTAGGGLAIGTTAVKGTAGKVHILYGTANADTNWLTYAPLVIESDGSAAINIRTPNNTNGRIVFSDPDLDLSGALGYVHTTDYMFFTTAGSARMRLNATGLYIGGSADPSYTLDVNGTARISGITLLTDTTECTGADTGALQVSGGAYIAGNLVCLGGGDIATNCAMGRSALEANTTGSYNTAMGRSALEANTTGYYNTAMGHYALLDNTTGFSNTAIGRSAGSGLTTGNNVTCIGYNAQPSADNATNQITLGNSFVSSLRCQVALTVLSDARDKTNISKLTTGLDFINELNPILFNRDNRDWYEDKKADGSKALKNYDLGFLAQEVMKLEDKYDKKLGIVNRSVPEKLEMTYEKFIPIIIKAIQELSEKIDNIKK